MQKIFILLAVITMTTAQITPVFAAALVAKTTQETEVQTNDETLPEVSEQSVTISPSERRQYEKQPVATIEVVPETLGEKQINEFALGQVSYDVDPSVVADKQAAIAELEALTPQSPQPYEVAVVNEANEYFFIEGQPTYEKAVALAQTTELAEGEEVVVINENGMVTYSNSNVARIFKTINGSLYNGCNINTDLYRDASLGTPVGYINHCYIDDVPVLAIQGDAAKIMVAGKVAWVQISTDLLFVTPDKVVNPSYYANENGHFVHYISKNLTTLSSGGTKLELGLANPNLAANVKYYSYDGNYFYTDPETIGPDMNDGIADEAVNANDSYYNYFQNLPFNSKAVATAAQIDAYINANTQATSKLRNTGQAFIDAQEQYGINALIMLGIAINESNWGMSSIAQSKNNLFGLHAADVTPGEAADYFTSVADCIDLYASDWLAQGYADPQDWRYYGGMLGNKAMGANVKYASDAYWSEKAAAHMYTVDRGINDGTSKEWNYYSLGWFTTANNVRNSSGQVIYPITAPDSNGGLSSYSGYTNTPIVLKDTDASDEKYGVWPARNNILNSMNDVPAALPYEWQAYATVDTAGVQILNQGITIRGTVPIFAPMQTLVIQQGQAYDLMSGVSASDEEDGDLTNQVTVTGVVDHQVVGTYTVQYHVSDSDQNEASVERQVEVVKMNTPPEIHGVEDTTTPLNHWFDMWAGVSATDSEDGDLTYRLQIDGYVDYMVPGTYTLTYRVMDNEMNETIVYRQVEVVKTNTPPEIHGVEDRKVKQYERFEPTIGVYSFDEEDGYLYDISISGEVDTSIVGNYQLTYSVTDSDGNTTTVVRTISVISNAAPILFGVQSTFIVQNQDFDPLAGVSAIDEEDGDVSALITVRGTVDTSELGEYMLTYQVADSDGNTSEIRRSIYVYTGEKPIIDGTHRYYISNDTLYLYDGPGGAVTIPEGVKTIGKAAFQGKRIRTVNFPESLEVIEAEAFWGNRIDELTFPANLKTIGERAFYNNTSYYTKQTLHFTGEKAPTFGNEWYWSYYRSDKITIQHPNTWSWAFVSDKQLQANSNMNLERIVGYAAELSGVEDIAILQGTTFDPLAGVEATDHYQGDITSKLKVSGEVDSTQVGTYQISYVITSSDGHKTGAQRNVTVHNQANVIADGIHEDGEHIFFTRNGGQLYKYLGPSGTVTIPDGVIAIEEEVFLTGFNTKVEAVHLPNSLTYIGDAAFQGGGLYDLVLPESVREIGDFAFSGNNLKYLKLPSQLKVIGEKAFYSNMDLQKVIFTGDFPELGNEWLWAYRSRAIQIEHPSTFEWYNISDEQIISGSNIVIERQFVNYPSFMYVQDINIALGLEFDPMKMVQATDEEDGELTSAIIVTGSVDTSKVGTYKLTYRVTDSDGNTTSIERIVTVRVSEKPVFTGIEDVTLNVGTEFDPIAGVLLTDKEDGEIHKFGIDGTVDTNQVGVYVLTYIGFDSDSNETRSERIITVRSNEQPVIIGANQMTLFAGANFDELSGITATDEEDGDLTAQIQVESNVNCFEPGIYTVNYRVTDSSENTTQVQRSVVVVPGLAGNEVKANQLVSGTFILMTLPNLSAKQFEQLQTENGQVELELGTLAHTTKGLVITNSEYQFTVSGTNLEIERLQTAEQKTAGTEYQLLAQVDLLSSMLTNPQGVLIGTLTNVAISEQGLFTAYFTEIPVSDESVTPEVDAEADTGFGPEGNVTPEVDAEADTGFGPEGNVTPEVDAEADTGVGPEGNVTPEVDAEADTGVGPEGNVTPEVDAEADTGVNPEIDVEAEQGFGPEGNVTPEVDAQADADETKPTLPDAGDYAQATLIFSGITSAIAGAWVTMRRKDK